MKARIITTTILLFSVAAFAAEAPPKTESSASATAVTTGTGGKATITIDVNGKKETREIEIGNGAEIKVGTPPKLNLPASSFTNLKITVRTTWLGVAAEEVSEELRAQMPLDPGAGLIVRSVIPDSPAAAAGLQKNDVLMKLDDQLLTNPQQLRTLVSSKNEGDTVRLTYFRRGQQSVQEVKLATHEGGDGSDFVAKFSEWLPGLKGTFDKHLAPLILQSKAVVVDKDGNVVGNQPDLDATIEKLEKILRDAGADENAIAETKHTLAETTKAIHDALSQAGAAKQEIQKGAAEVAKALEQARAAMEKAHKLSEDATRKEKSTAPAPTPLEKP